MARLQLTIQQRHGERWSVVALEQRDDEPPRQSEGELALDLVELAALADPIAYGTRLGQALFTGPVLDAFIRAQARSGDRLSIGLQIEAPELRGLAWSRLCARFERGWDFLRFDQRTPFCLQVPTQAQHQFPTLLRRDLRALVVVASPDGLDEYGLDGFDADAAAAAVRDALGPIPADLLAAGPGALGPPTVEQLCAQLTAQRYTILHIVCHGAVARGGDSVLYLAGPDGETDAVPAAELLRRLGRLGGDVGLPHLVFLAACESAAPQAEAALGALAPRLCRELGLPWVVAMSGRISIATAAALVGPFYRQLGQHGLPDLALGEACSQLAERRDAGVPVLFGRAGGRPLFRAGTLDLRSDDERRTAETPILSLTPLPASLARRFVGRDALLETLASHLAGPAGGRQRPGAALVGPAGAGKTRAALELVWRHRDDFSGGVFWLDAADEARRDAQFHALLRQLDPGVPSLAELRRDGTDVAALLGDAVRRWNPGAPKLWVLDALPEPIAGLTAPQVLPWCPAPGEVRLLVTTRARGLSLALRELEVGPLAPADGVQLLSAGLPDGLDPDEAARIVALLDGLPLPLEIAAKSLEFGDLGPADLLALLTTDGLAALDETTAVLQQAGVRLPSVGAALRASVARLPADALLLLRLLAQFGPTPLPEALVKALGRAAGRGARATLVARNLVTGPARNIYGSVSRLLAECVRTRAAPDDFARACEAALAILDPDACRDSTRWAALEPCVPHAEALWARVQALDEDTTALAMRLSLLYFSQDRLLEARRLLTHAAALARPLPPDHITPLQLHVSLGRVFSALGEHGEAVPLLRSARDGLVRTLGPEAPFTLIAGYSYGLALRDAGRFADACAELRRVADIQERVLGPTHDDTMSTLHTLGITLTEADDLAAAEPHARALLERVTGLYGPDHRDVLAARNALASVLDLRGDSEGAVTMLEEIVADATRLFGPEHAHTLLYMEGLARLRRDHGDPAGARPLLVEILGIQRRRLGPDHPTTLRCTGDLANVMADLGELVEAEQMQAQLLHTLRSRQGPDHPSVIAALGDLALFRYQRDQLGPALVGLQEAFERASAALGPDHRTTLAIRNNLAQVLYSSGQFAAARAHQEAVLAIQLRRRGPDHSATALAQHSLALARAAEGDLAGALPLHEAAVATSERRAGPRHPSTLSFIAGLAQTLYRMNVLPRARALQEDLLRERRWTLGENHPLTLMAINDLANTLCGLADLEGARALFEEALAGYRVTLPPEHRHTLTCMRNLAVISHALGRLEPARALLSQLIAAYRKRFGDTHVETIRVTHELARLFFSQGDPTSARALYRQLLAQLRALHGDDHIETLAARNNLALCEAGLGEHAVARAELLAIRASLVRLVEPGHPMLANLDTNLAALRDPAAPAGPTPPSDAAKPDTTTPDPAAKPGDTATSDSASEPAVAAPDTAAKPGDTVTSDPATEPAVATPDTAGEPDDADLLDDPNAKPAGPGLPFDPNTES